MEIPTHRDVARPGERARAVLRLYLLGRFEVVRDDAPIPAQAWRRRRPADLLTLVALADTRSLGREDAIAALWPDKDPTSGANNLHRALYDLRQILGGRWVDIEHGRVRLRDDVWVDVDAFERAAADGSPERLAEAVALYRGDLAPDDLDLPWLAPRRAALRARFADAAAPLARAAADAGDAARAIPLYRRLLEVEPAGEETHRALMRLLAETGRRAEALRQYDACETALRRAGAGPASEATRALRAAIQLGEVGPAQARPAVDGARRAARRLLGTTEPPPVRGRAPILLLLEALAEQGSGALVLLGERGAGKTRLAVEGARIAQSRGAGVLTGVPPAAGTSAPYALFADVFGEEARAGGGVPDPFADAAAGGGSPEALRLRIFDAVSRGLATVADGRPVYLLLDDLHDADESSLNLLHFLARRARELRLTIVATCREDAIHAGTPIQMALAHLDGGRLARGVRVPRLGLAATREQVADLVGGAPPEPLVGAIYRATDGCPFLVEEAVRAQRDSGQQVPADPAASLRARVVRLGPRVEELLAAAAVVGRRFDLELVRPVTGLTAHEAVDAIEACLEAGLLDEDGAGYHFHNALGRDLLLEGLAPERRAALHGAVADALEAAGGHPPPSEAIAHHARLAGQAARALRHLVAAGHRAAERAGFAEALRFYSDALDLSGAAGAPETAARRLELLDALGRVQLALGDVSGAARAFAEGARMAPGGGAPPPEQRARAHRLAALALAAGGDLAAADAELAAGLDAAGDGWPDEAAALLHLRAQLLWHGGRFTEARATAAACVAAAERAGDADLVARGQDVAALALGMLGEPAPAPAPAAGSAPRQDTAPEHPLDVHLVLWERDLLGDLSCAELARAAALLVERARLRGDPDAEAVGRTGEGGFALAAWQPDAAEVALRAAIDGHRAAGSALGEALAAERLATLLTTRGRLDDALELLRDAIVVAERATLRRHALTRLHAAEARNRLAAGQLHAADDAVREASETAARQGDCTACDAAFRPEVVRVALLRGRIAEAEAESLALEEIGRARGGRGLQAVARLARARVLAAQDRADEALLALAQARTLFLSAGQRYEAARCVRLEVRLRGPGGLAPALRELDALVLVDADA